MCPKPSREQKISSEKSAFIYIKPSYHSYHSLKTELQYKLESIIWRSEIVGKGWGNTKLMHSIHLSQVRLVFVIWMDKVYSTYSDHMGNYIQISLQIFAAQILRKEEKISKLRQGIHRILKVHFELTVISFSVCYR